MKILMVTESLVRGGKERRLVELLRYFSNYEKIVIELVLLKDVIEYPEIKDIPRTNITIFRRKIKKDPMVFFRILNLARTFDPDLIHSWGSMPSVYTFMIARFLRKPFLNAMISHGKCKIFSNHWFRAKITFPFSQVIFANSNAGLRAYNVSRKKGIVVYNGFNYDRFQNLTYPVEEIKKWNIKTPHVVGMVAAFDRRKDYATFLTTARNICAYRNDVTFMAIGGGNELEMYRKQYSDCSRIIFTDNVFQIESLLNILNVGVVLTATSNNEGISNAILELMAFGKPVIASGGGGTEEIIENNVSGIKITPASVTELEDAVNKILNDKKFADYLGKNAEQKIKNTFNIEQMGENTLRVYEKMLRKYKKNFTEFGKSKPLKSQSQIYTS
jgi:glycosyltransferase involved in cell wall biosynthesis